MKRLKKIRNVALPLIKMLVSWFYFRKSRCLIKHTIFHPLIIDLLGMYYTLLKHPE